MSKYIYGYMRISTQKESQTTDRQELELKRYAKENGFKFNEIIGERVSGSIKAENRPQYKKLKGKLRRGDALVIEAIDRLGRNANDIQIELKELEELGVKVVILNMPYLNVWDNIKDDGMYRMIRDILTTLQSHLAEQERENTIRRINQGLAVAKAKGVELGRPKAVLTNDFVRKYEKYLKGDYGEMTKVDFAKMLDIGRSTLYKYINIYEEAIKDVD